MWYKVKVVFKYHAGGAWQSQYFWIDTNTPCDDSQKILEHAISLLDVAYLPISAEIVASCDTKPEEVVSCSQCCSLPR